MTELPLIFLGGLLGSSHCIGMCGPLALALGVQESRLHVNLGRQLLFSAGRITTYGFLGAVAGATGWWLAQRPQSLINVQSLLVDRRRADAHLAGPVDGRRIASIHRTLVQQRALQRRQMVQDPADRTRGRERDCRRSLHWFHSLRTRLRLHRVRSKQWQRAARLGNHGRLWIGHGPVDGACRLRRHFAFHERASAGAQRSGLVRGRDRNDLGSARSRLSRARRERCADRLPVLPMTAAALPLRADSRQRRYGGGA